MRLPVVTPLSTKDGEANKNSRMTNCLVENNPTGARFAALRPALATAATSSGNGNGVTVFNDDLIMVFGGSLRELSFGAITTIDDQRYDFVQSTY